MKWVFDENPIACISMPRDHTFVFVNTDDGVQMYKMDSDNPLEEYRPDPNNLGKVPVSTTDGWTENSDGDKYTTTIKFLTSFYQW